MQHYITRQNLSKTLIKCIFKLKINRLTNNKSITTKQKGFVHILSYIIHTIFKRTLNEKKLRISPQNKSWMSLKITLNN